MRNQTGADTFTIEQWKETVEDGASPQRLDSALTYYIDDLQGDGGVVGLEDGKNRANSNLHKQNDYDLPRKRHPPTLQE